MQDSTIYKAGLYLRLSKDDEQQGESISIGTQRAILTDYCTAHGYKIQKVYVDDGYSGLNFDRPGFQELLDDVLAAYDQFVSAAYHHNDAYLVSFAEETEYEHDIPSVVCFKDISTPVNYFADEGDVGSVRYADYLVDCNFVPHLLKTYRAYEWYNEPAFWVSITMEQMYDLGYIYDHTYEIIIPADVFREFAKSFQQIPVVIDQEYLEYVEQTYPDYSYFSPIVPENAIAYKAFTIDRNTIENATPEQLLVLYTMLEDIITINFPGYDQYVQENDVNYSD